jgi:hypothetical protein
MREYDDTITQSADFGRRRQESLNSVQQKQDYRREISSTLRLLIVLISITRTSRLA